MAERTVPDEPDETILICSRADVRVTFADDLFGVCTECGCAIRFRPHSPTNVIRICYECMPAHTAKHGGGTVEVTQKTLDEMALFFAKPKGRKN